MIVGKFFWPPQLYILNPLAWASCARMIDSSLFLLKKPFVNSNPKKYEQPLTSLTFTSESRCPLLLSTGSAHMRSQKMPDFGISLNRSTREMSSNYINPKTNIFYLMRDASMDA